MAKNLVYKNDNKQNRAVVLAATHGSGEPVIAPSGAPAITVTGSGDYAESVAIAGVGTLTGVLKGGVGLTGKEVTIAFSGTWEFPEDDIAGTTAATATQGQEVYITSGLALTTTEGSNTFYGTVDFPKDYDKTRGMVPVKIGDR